MKSARFMEYLFKRCLQLRAILNVFYNMAPFLKNFLSKLIVIWLLFGQLCVHLFGGEINSQTPSKYQQHVGSADGNNYQYLNFNDFPSAMITMWSLIVNNCWPTIVYQATERSNQIYGTGIFVLYIV